MTRGSVIWLVVALAAGFGLFAIKYRVQGLEDNLARTNRQILQEEETIHQLKAEWSFLNQPDRIEALARRYLQMAPLAGKQYGAIDDLSWRAEGAPNAAAASAAQPSTPLAGSASAAAPNFPGRFRLPPKPPEKVTLARDIR
jgi:cell division protein FtsL